MVWKYQNQLFRVKSIWKRHCIYSISWFNLLRFQLQMFKNLLFVTLRLTWRTKVIWTSVQNWSKMTSSGWKICSEPDFLWYSMHYKIYVQKLHILTRNYVKSTFELPSPYIWLKLYSNQSWKGSVCSWQNQKCLYIIIWMFIK